MSIICGLIGCEKMIFVKAFISHVRRAFRESFVLLYEMARTYCQLQYDTCVQELEEQYWKIGRLERSAFSEINDYLMRESSSYDAIVMILLAKVIITRISMFKVLPHRISSIRDVINIIYHSTRIISFSKIHVIASNLYRQSKISRRGILQRHIETSRIFVIRSETIQIPDEY